MSTRAEREKLNREYLKDKVDAHLNRLIIELLREKPEDVMSFIYKWARGQCGAQEVEAEVVAPVKVEEAKHEEAPAPEVKEEAKVEEAKVEAAPEPEHEIRDAPVSSPDPHTENYERPEIDSVESEEDDDVPDMDELAKKNKKASQRISVSAEAYGKFNKKSEYEPKVIEKTEETQKRIRARLDEAFMFAALDEKEKGIVIGAMEEVSFKEGDTVIKQGADGDVLYTVDSGSLKCFKRMNKDDAEDTYLKTYVPGEAFGELALLYNAPRAATIIAAEESVCFSLDRDCFNHIVKESTIKRRDRFEDFISKIELLQDLDPYERSKITDCLHTEHFKDQDKIITEGETGDKFYFIESGTAQALKKNAEGENAVVFDYKVNDYFGELALLNDEVRAATIIATSDLTVDWIDRSAFKRLLGPLESVLRRNEERYTKYIAAEKTE